MRPLKEILKNLETYTKEPVPVIKKAVTSETEKQHKRHVERTSVPGEILKPETPDLEASLSGESLRQAQESQDGVQSDIKKVSSEVESEGLRERAIKKLDAPLASKLSRAEFRLTGDELKVVLNGGDSVFADSIKKNLRLIEKIFSEEIGTAIKVKIETIKEKRVTKKDLKERVMGEPIIKEALELFEGRIADVIPITEERKQTPLDPSSAASRTDLPREE
jgi:hypothetical protein